ncbi:MAG: type IV pilin protein [Pseudomonadota bacterium]
MKRHAAFTLVELMIVLVIVAILAALSYPAYTAYMIKTRRAEAQVALLEAMQHQERYFSLHNTYLAFSADSSGDDELRFPWWLGANPLRSAYELSGGACKDLTLQSCIELRAVPGTSRVDPKFRDADCETLTLNSAGEHGAGGKQTGCWP